MARFLRWAIFGVVISVLPLGFAYVDLLARGQAATIAGVIGNGELLVVVWGLCAGALGELFGTDGRPTLKIVFGGLTLIAIIAAAHFFASITEARVAKVALDDNFVVQASVGLFVFSLGPAAFCIWITES